MREADLCAVNDAIADTFDESEDIVVFGVEDNAFEGVLTDLSLAIVAKDKQDIADLNCF